MKVTFRPLKHEEYVLAEQFKRATAVDGGGRADLFDEWFPPEKPYAAFLARLQAFDPECCCLALVGDIVVGNIDMMIKEDGALGKLNNIYLLPEWRGKGLGAQMDAFIMGFFRRHNAKRAMLITNPGNAKLIGFYERVGWVLAEEAPHGMVVMRRTLD